MDAIPIYLIYIGQMIRVRGIWLFSTWLLLRFVLISCSENKKLFTVVSPSETNIDFANQSRETDPVSEFFTTSIITMAAE